jgi:hypothetical protein
LTPREIAARIKGRVGILQREAQERAWLAWHVAALQRAKKLPDFKKFVPRDKKPQSADEQARILDMWKRVLPDNGAMK